MSAALYSATSGDAESVIARDEVAIAMRDAYMPPHEIVGLFSITPRDWMQQVIDASRPHLPPALKALRATAEGMSAALKTPAVRRPATTPENIARINLMFEHFAEPLNNLYERWLDEREHEDIADYATAIRAKLPSGFELVAMKKRPFGFTFSIGTDAVYQMTASSRGVTWKRLS